MRKTSTQKKSLTSLVIKKMPMKTTQRYYYILIKMPKFEKTTHAKCWKGDEGIKH